jgi:hypothetical protein
LKQRNAMFFMSKIDGFHKINLLKLFLPNIKPTL